MKYTRTAAIVGLALTAGAANATVLSWTGATDSEIGTATNWESNTRPNLSNGDSGTVAGSTATQFSTQGVSNLDVEFTGTSSLKNNQAKATRFGASNYTFSDSSSFNMQGSDLANDNLILGYGGDVNLDWNSSGSLFNVANIDIGRTQNNVGTTIFTQTDGSILASGSINFKDGSYLISGGSLTADSLSFVEQTGEVTSLIDFSVGSTGTITLAAVYDFATAITDGHITYGGVVQTDTSNFIITSTSITAAAVPEPSSTALIGLGGLALILRRRK